MKEKLFFTASAICAVFFLSCSRHEQLKAAALVLKEFSEVSVHDPAVVKGEDGFYYIFGSHLAVAKSSDLMNWEYVNKGIKNSGKVIPNVRSEMKEAFEWSKSTTFWAPDVVFLNGTFKMYYCNCKGDVPLSCIGIASSDSVAGPYKNGGLLLKSGMDASVPDEDGNLYQAASDPNAVDPNVFFSSDGRLWMIYGSYSGGIYIKELDSVTGLPLAQGYGKKLLGGNHLRIEAPYVIFNRNTGYYYLFLSFGGLDSFGGYNIRVCRSKNPDGPYSDSEGKKMTDCKGAAGSFFSDTAAERFGAKLIGGYKFVWKEGEEGEHRAGFLSPGHNSCLFREEDGCYFIIHHTRFEGKGEKHEVRVRQMFFNSNGWPVLAPYRYAGEAVAPCSRSAVPGVYKFISHGRDISAEMKLSSEIRLEKNGKIRGAVSGEWELYGGFRIALTIDGSIYDGVFLRQWDEDGKKYVMVFTALCEKTGVSVWGSGLACVE